MVWQCRLVRCRARSPGSTGALHNVFTCIFGSALICNIEIVVRAKRTLSLVRQLYCGTVPGGRDGKCGATGTNLAAQDEQVHSA